MCLTVTSSSEVTDFGSIPRLGSTLGALVKEKMRMISPSPMKSTHRRMYQLERVSSDTEAFAPFAPALGTHMRISLGTTLGYSNLRISNGPNVPSAEEPQKKALLFRSALSQTLLMDSGSNSGIQPGSRVTVFLKSVPQTAAAASPSPIIMFGLHQHEHKVTVMNVKVQRNTEYDGSVRSKVYSDKAPFPVIYADTTARIHW
jgi:hypothetical protein